MRFVATADWQLGMTAHYLGDEARPRFQQARLDAVRRIGEVAANRGARFVVVGGDVFETNQLDRAIVARTMEVLRSFTVPVVLLPGNHDPLDAASIYDSPQFTRLVPDHVHVLRDSTLFSPTPGVEVVGAPWFSKRPLEDLVARACVGLEPTPEGIVRVVVGHGAVSTLNPDAVSPSTIDVAALEATLAKGVAHFVVLGDRHSTTKVGERIWYPGTPEVTARREIDPGNVLLVDVGDEIVVESVHVGSWRFLDVEARLENGADVSALRERLAGVPDKDRVAVWLSLAGTLSTGEMVRLDETLEHSRDLFARIEGWERHTDLVVVPDDHDFSEMDLRGYARGAVAELVARSRSGGDDAEVATDALRLLYRFAGGAR